MSRFRACSARPPHSYSLGAMSCAGVSGDEPRWPPLPRGAFPNTWGPGLRARAPLFGNAFKSRPLPMVAATINPATGEPRAPPPSDVPIAGHFTKTGHVWRGRENFDPSDLPRARTRAPVDRDEPGAAESRWRMGLSSTATRCAAGRFAGPRASVTPRCRGVVSRANTGGQPGHIVGRTLRIGGDKDLPPA